MNYERSKDSSIAAEALDQAMRLTGVTQNQLVERTRLSTSAISDILASRSQPTLPELCQLLRATGSVPSVSLTRASLIGDNSSTDPSPTTGVTATRRRTRRDRNSTIRDRSEDFGTEEVAAIDERPERGPGAVDTTTIPASDNGHATELNRILRFWMPIQDHGTGVITAEEMIEQLSHIGRSEINPDVMDPDLVPIAAIALAWRRISDENLEQLPWKPASLTRIRVIATQQRPPIGPAIPRRRRSRPTDSDRFWRAVIDRRQGALDDAELIARLRTLDIHAPSPRSRTASRATMRGDSIALEAISLGLLSPEEFLDIWPLFEVEEISEVSEQGQRCRAKRG